MRALLTRVAGTLIVLGLTAAPATATPTVTELAAPTQPVTAVATGPDGRLWITETPSPGYVGHMSTSGTDLVELAGGGAQGLPLGAGPYDVVAGADGAIWVSLSEGAGGIARITTAGVVSNPITSGYTPGAAPHGIAWGPDGHVWFAESAKDAIAELDPATGVVTEHPLPVGSAPEDIVAGPDGNLWYTAPGANGVGRITTAGAAGAWAVPTANSSPYGIAVGGDGALWFTESGTNRVGRMPSPGVVEDWAVSGLVNPRGIVAGGDGAMWVTSSGMTGDVMRIALDKTVSYGFTGLTNNRSPWFAGNGPDGNVWFGQHDVAGRVGRVTVPPALGATEVTGTTDTTATITTRVRPNAQPTTFKVQLGTTTAYGKQTANIGIGSGGTVVAATVTLLGLTPQTTYHARLVASNDAGTSNGPDFTFTTTATPPPVDTNPGTKPPDAAPEPAKPADVAPSPETAPVTAPVAPEAPLAITATTPPPEMGKSVALTEVKGTILIKDAKGKFVPLDGAATLPTGTVVDATNGTIELESAVDANGATQKGQFWGGQFQITQPADGRGMTQLTLAGGSFKSCNKQSARKASAAASKRPPKRSLWGSDNNGRFQTRGRGSVATVRGTRWETTDRCDGTMTHVLEGAVEVRDLVKNKTVLVTALHAYLARVKQR